MMRLGIAVTLIGVLWTVPGGAAPVYPTDEAWTTPPSPQPLTRPGYRQTVVDPEFGSRITRISGNEMNPTNSIYLQHDYSKDQPWNADMTLIKLSGAVFILNANDYTVFRQWNYHNDSRWSTVNPDILFYTTGTQFRKVNVRTNVDTLVHNFSQGNITMGPYEGNISIGDHRVVFVVGTRVICYDIDTDTILGDKVFNSNDISDWVSISASGNYVIVASNTGAGVHAYNLTLNFVRTLYAKLEHGDSGYDLLNNEVWVQTCGDRFALMSNAINTNLTPSGCAGHVSTRNYRRYGWVYMSHFGLIYAKRLDSSTIVERFAHHRSSEATYDSQAKAVVSPDGSKVMWNSDWGSGTVYAYVAEMPGNGGGGDLSPPAAPRGLSLQ